MFDGLTKPKFYVKCRSALKMTKTRLEAIKKKRSSVQRYLKSDIADLLKEGLDYNAYGRAEGLLIEQNMTLCYDDVEKFCVCIYSQLKTMPKQRECPEECKEAVPSMIYAAARFADLPELRDLRTLFTEKYGSSVEQFLDKEFVEKLKGNSTTKEMKIQLMHDIANEFSVEWDSKTLEKKLFTPPQPANDQLKQMFLKDDNDDGGYKSQKTENENLQKRDGNLSSSLSSSEEEIGSSSSVGSCSEEDSSGNMVVPKPSSDLEAKFVKPKSVRRKNLKLPPGREEKEKSIYEEAGGNLMGQNLVELKSPPGRAASLLTELESESSIMQHARANSLQPEMLGAGHVHPKLPEYDDLAARIAALQG